MPKGMAWAGVAVSFGFLLFRIYVRLKIFRRLFIDDPFLIAAWLMTLANAIIWQVNVRPLYLTIGVASGQITSLPPDFLPEFFAYSHAQFSSSILTYASLYLTKFSFLLFFRKLGNKVPRQRVIWWSALVFVIASYAVSFCVVDFRCLVGSKATALGWSESFCQLRICLQLKPNVQAPMLLGTNTYQCEQLRLLILRQMLPVGLESLLAGNKENPYPDTYFSHTCFNQHPLEGTNKCSEEASVGRYLLAHSFYHMYFDHKSHCYDRWSISRYSQANLLGKFGAVCWYATCGDPFVFSFTSKF